MKFERWILPGATSQETEALIACGYNPLCAQILTSRGIITEEQAYQALRMDEGVFCDPFLMKDMEKAVERVRAALEHKEKIAVYGDYDVDGITSTCLLTDYLRSKGAETISYIPDRLEEGYGVNVQAINCLAESGVSLIITVDCGITLDEEITLAKDLGVEVIVTDHHECKEKLPPAVAVLNPHRPDCSYPFKELAGVGVALKMVMALEPEEKRNEICSRYLWLAAIGTVADVMLLTGENRTIVANGLPMVKNCGRPGVELLLREAGLEKRDLTASTISYVLAPRLNASGRMGKADIAVELFLTKDVQRAEELTGVLCSLNDLRKSIESEIFEECINRIGDRSIPPAFVLESDVWHQGVVGIVASRLVERFHRPVFMICISEGKGKGSCRGPEGANLFKALEQTSMLLEGFGGHERAAGFTILENQIPAFRAAMECYFAQQEPTPLTLSTDGEVVDGRLLTEDNIESLKILEPCGAGNPRPILVLRSCQVVSCIGVGDGKHLKLRLERNNQIFDAIFFQVTPEESGIENGDRIDVAFSPEINEFRDRRSVQLQLVDFRSSKTRFQVEMELYQRLRSGDDISRREAEELYPSRQEFVAVWKYLCGQNQAPIEVTAYYLAKTIARTYRIRETLMRTMVCLDVLQDTGLIRVEEVSDHIRIHLNEKRDKVDLEQALLMRRLRKILEM